MFIKTVAKRKDFVGVFFAYVLLAIGLEWPLPLHFSTELAGNRGDAWQHVWNFWWLRHALTHGENPFFTTLLYHPSGVPLWLHTLDLPDAVPALLLGTFLGPIASFNAIHCSSFVFSALAFYALAREFGTSKPAALIAGAIYTAQPFHLSHAVAHLSLLPLHWPALFALCFRRAARRYEDRWWLAAGLFATLSVFANWYFGPICAALATAILLETLSDHAFATGAFRRVFAATCLAAIFIVPFAAKGAYERAKEPYFGDHDSLLFSADLEELFLPAPISHWRSLSGDRPAHWTGNMEENGAYLGLSLLALATIAFSLRRKKAWPWIALLISGVMLSLGPQLHVAGRLLTGRILPMAWLEAAIPPLQEMGCPVRWSLLASTALAILAAISLDTLALKHRSIFLLGLVPIAELWPAPATLSSMPPLPPLFETWAKDPTPWAVLDATDSVQGVWNQMHHGHPSMATGYISRRPRRLDAFLENDPSIAPLLAPKSFTRVDPQIDFEWSSTALFESPRFAVRWTGVLNAPSSGLYKFTLVSNAVGALRIDGALTVADPTPHVLQAESGAVPLSAGPHAIEVEFLDNVLPTTLRLFWEEPGIARSIVPASALRTPEGWPGLRGDYQLRRVVFDRGADVARETLRRLNVRYLIYPASRRDYAIEVQLGLKPIYEDTWYRIYETMLPTER